MKFKVNDLDISSDGQNVVIINILDADKHDIRQTDRLKLTKGELDIIAAVDISESAKTVKPGEIGCFEEVLKKLNIKHGDNLEVSLSKKPESLQYIKKKLDGKKLIYQEYLEIMRDVVQDKLTDIELTYFVSANYTHGMTMDEIVDLTKAMVDTGKKIEFDSYPVVDLHSIGGVPNNRITILVVPIIAYAGIKIPKTSSRAITSPAGTADTMEVVANVSVDIEKLRQIIDEVNGCIIWGGAINMAPADDKIIKIESPLSIDPEGQLLASVMSKKASISPTHLLIELPIAKDAKLKNKREAENLSKKFIELGKKLGIRVETITTDGEQPIGNGIGCVLEMRDVLDILHQTKDRPKDLEEKSLFFAGKLFELCGHSKKGEGYKKAKYILQTGKALEQFNKIIVAQGKKNASLKLGEYKFEVKSPKSGKIYDIDNKIISKIARIAGSPKDHGAGIYLNKKMNDNVKTDEILYTIYSNNKTKLNYAIELQTRNCGYMISK